MKLLRQLLAVTSLILVLTACSLTKDKPNNAAAFTSDQILALAIQVEQAQQDGLLSEEEGDKYIKYLITANKVLGSTIEEYRSIPECSDSDSKFACVQILILKVQEKL